MDAKLRQRAKAGKREEVRGGGARIKEPGERGKRQEGAELKERKAGWGIKPGGANAIRAEDGGWGSAASDCGDYQKPSSASGSMCGMACCAHVGKRARRCARSFETTPQSAV